jgi:hypothetical protein
MLCGMFSVINLDPFLNSYVAYWHFSDLTGPQTMSVVEGKADLPVARPDF